MFFHHYGIPNFGCWYAILLTYGQRKDLRKCKINSALKWLFVFLLINDFFTDVFRTITKKRVQISSFCLTILEIFVNQIRNNLRMDNQENLFNTENNDQAGEGISLSNFLTNVQSSNEEMRIAETEFH